MKRFLQFLLLIILAAQMQAQLDREHWFAPMFDRVSPQLQTPSPYQRLYLSTNRTTPFPVQIYNNNVLIGTVTISKGNPQKFDVNRSYIIATTSADLFTPTTKGLYVKADYSFYANLRFSVFNHAEIITSKGAPSKGTKFYAGMVPLSVSTGIVNFTTGILATEDNTVVTVSGYSPAVMFSNGASGAVSPVLTVTLNKGQSYIIEGQGVFPGNSDGFIGAKIESTKPVNVTNGNFNGQYAGAFENSSDIMMDQSVPVNQLGNEFILVRGNDSFNSNMEGALVIGTENNTQIYLNNETAPTATINEGEYYRVPQNKYIGQGNGHFNMYIHTSKNAYVYQLLAGAADQANTVATGGFNFIPALNCYLPKQINELGFINENQVMVNGPTTTSPPVMLLNIPTRLNLVTQVGGVVAVNGVTPPATTGPFPITGNPNWVTYGIPNVTGTVTVTSTKALTAGITAGSNAVGYGGFFAGFPTQPVIVSSGGTCIPNIVLGVDPLDYDTYQWYLNGAPIPGATGATYTPTIPGYYSVSVTMGNCAPLVTSELKVEKCTVNTTASYNVCTSQTIVPAFSTPPTTPQTISLPTVSITTAPTLGTATVNPTTGVITYTPTTPNVAATDTFTYTFCGNHPQFPECESVTVTINLLNIPVNNPTLTACNVNGQGTFNLTSANVTTQPQVSITYYPTLADAQSENPAAQINYPTTYTAPAGTIVYAVVKSDAGCKSIAQITLNLNPLAVVADYTGTYCDDDLNGTIVVSLPAITPQVLTNAAYFNVRYYATLADATAGNANTLPNNYTITANTTVYIRVDSPDGCAPVIKALNLVVGNKIPLITNTTTQTVCDDDFDGVKVVALNTFISSYTTDPGVTATFFATLANAQNNTGALPNLMTVTTSGTFYFRFEKPGQCPEVASITINIKTPKKSDVLADQQICAGVKTTLDAGPGFEAYAWSTGATTQVITNVGVGTYWVDLTFNGCVYRQTVHVTAAELPQITAIDINGGTVTVTATGGTPPYQYSLDGITWQSSNVFQNLPRGTYTVYVMDSLKCAPVSKDFAIINLINVITPDDDGINDAIDYSELLTKEQPVFRVFDRYGSELFRGTASNRFIWNGRTAGNRPVPTATYWYILQWKEFGSQTLVQHTSWLVVKNRDQKYFDD